MFLILKETIKYMSRLIELKQVSLTDVFTLFPAIPKENNIPHTTPHFTVCEEQS